MRTLFIILGIIAAVLAVVLSVLPVSNMAFIPAIAALIFGVVALYLSKKQHASKKSIQLIFLMTILALALATYKAVFSSVEIGDTEELIEREKKSEEDAIEELEGLEIELED